MKLMVLGFRKSTTGGPQSIIECIIGIIHAIATEDGLEAALVERFVVCNQWKPFYQRYYLRPDLRKNRSIVGIFAAESMHPCTEIGIIIGLRLNEGIEGVHDFAVTYYDHPHATDTRPLAIGGFKINRCKVLSSFGILMY